MSLLDALLLDPAPFNVWIADRSSDQQKGSGTISHPFRGDGGRLDDVLKSLPDNTRVHTGPGTFDTAGLKTASWAMPRRIYVALASADDGQMACLEAGGFADSGTNIHGNDSSSRCQRCAA